MCKKASGNSGNNCCAQCKSHKHSERSEQERRADDTEVVPDLKTGNVQATAVVRDDGEYPDRQEDITEAMHTGIDKASEIERN